MDTVNAVISNTPAVEPAALHSDAGDGDAFEKALDQARQRQKVRASVLARNKLANRAGQDGPFSFMKGYQGAGDVAKALDVTRAGLPSTYKKQVGLGLMALGRNGSSANSMLSGAGLMNCRSSAEALKGVFDSLGAERSFLKLDQDALPALGQVLSDSGVDAAAVSGILAELAAGGLTLDEVFHSLSKLDLKAMGFKGGLTATDDGLPALGQFFGSLGASSEIVSAVTSGFKAGEPITAAALRSIIGSGDDGFLAPCLSEADARNLDSLLRSMGASDSQLNSLSNLLSQTKGQLTMNDFLNFIEGMETTPAKTVTGSELDLVKNILDNISRDQQLVKTPVFDEILTKMQMLGDREIDDNFMDLSPALQALRGGLTAMSQNAALGHNAGQGGLGGQSGQKNDREAREQYRQMLHATAHQGESTPAAAVEASETFAGYGGQETLARQISQKMVYSHRRGVNRLKMKLNPENLGGLEIELKVKGDQLVAHIRAESRAAYQALAGDIKSLKEALAEGGLEIADLTLAFDDADTGLSEFADLRELKKQSGPARAENITDDSPAPAAEARQGAVYHVI